MRDAVNRAAGVGLDPEESRTGVAFHVEPHSFTFKPGIDVDKLNQLADVLEAEEFARKHPD